MCLIVAFLLSWNLVRMGFCVFDAYMPLEPGNALNAKFSTTGAGILLVAPFLAFFYRQCMR